MLCFDVSNILYPCHAYVCLIEGSVKYVFNHWVCMFGVRFDGLGVSHRSGPLLQANTLYPYGLDIAAQSSRALMKAANEDVYQSKELDEENSLNYNYFDYRYYDQQLGRFISIDPGRHFTANGYSGMGNNPAMFVDPDGRFVWVSIGIGAAMGAFSGIVLRKRSMRRVSGSGLGILVVVQ